MEKFSFSLQTVLEYRQQVEEQVKGEFARTLQLEQQKKAELTQVLQEKNSLLDFPQETVSRMQVTRRYLQALSDQVLLCQNNLLELQQQKSQVRAQLITAQKQRKILERLREKQLVSYQNQVAREQQAQLDDFHRPVNSVQFS